MISVLLAALAASPSPAPVSSPLAQEPDGRVVVIGFDGADYRTTARMIERGELPNLARLATEGTFAPLRSTNPAESAAGWAALNTGVNPIENGVASFIVREFAGDRPTAGQGHLSIETVPMDEFDPGGFLGLVAGVSRSTLAGGAALGVALVFFVLLALLVRTNKLLAAGLAVLLGVMSGFAGWRAKSWVPTEIPGVYRNKVRADAFWDHAGQAGVPTIVLDAALAFDRPHHENTRVLSGLGLPDVRAASNGEWFLYTSDDTVLETAKRDDGSGERVRTPSGGTGSGTGRWFRFVERPDGVHESLVFGPVDLQRRSELQRRWQDYEDRLSAAGGGGWAESQELRDEQAAVEDELAAFGVRMRDGVTYPPARLDQHRASVPLEVAVDESAGVATITLGGRSQDLREGEWSDWYRMVFEISPLVRVSAITRCKVMSLSDPLEIYVNSLEIDPEAPPFWQPVSQPDGFASELAGWIDSPFETLGWSCMTNQMKDRALEPQTFLEDIEFTMKWRQKLVNTALARDDWRLLFGVYSTTDRVQHILYKHHDPEHPQHDPDVAAREVQFFGETIQLKDAIPAIYRQMDARVGEVLEALGPDDTLLLCADHGFSSFRRQVDVNAWLVDKGYMTLKPDAKQFEGSSTFDYVDWTRTQAYSLGLGMVYLNLAGREPQGVVDPQEGREILEAIQEDFLLLTDPDSGQPMGHDSEIVWDLYPGDWRSVEYGCADLMLGFAQNYRTAWRSVTGRMYIQEDEGGAPFPGPNARDNTNPWSGDHASNSPNLVTGIFFSNRPEVVPESGVNVMHIAPTVLDRLGVAVPEVLDEAPLERAP